MTRCCAKCARKLEEKYIVTEEGGAADGFCPMCFTRTVTQIYEITPRRLRYARRAGGGGERNRAGQQSRR